MRSKLSLPCIGNSKAVSFDDGFVPDNASLDLDKRLHPEAYPEDECVAGGVFDPTPEFEDMERMMLGNRGVL